MLQPVKHPLGFGKLYLTLSATTDLILDFQRLWPFIRKMFPFSSAQGSSVQTDRVNRTEKSKL